MLKNKDKFIVITAPSGTGKTTITKILLQDMTQISFAISATTREKRIGETHGIDYYYFSKKEFETSIAQEKFLEYEEVYKGKFYGTLFSEIDRMRKIDKYVLLDLGIQGTIKVKKLYKEKVMTIFVRPPSFTDLKKRLVKRGDTSLSEIEMRMKTAYKYADNKKYFDFEVVNENLDIAVKEIKEYIHTFLLNS